MGGDRSRCVSRWRASSCCSSSCGGSARGGAGDRAERAARGGGAARRRCSGRRACRRARAWWARASSCSPTRRGRWRSPATDGRPRRQRATRPSQRAREERRRTRASRCSGFGEGAARAAAHDASTRRGGARRRARRRAISAPALRALAASPEERPAAVVVVSDGRLDDPPEDASEASLRALGDALRVPIDTVATTRDAPADASIRRVSAAGAAVAHVPLPLRVEVGCAGGLACDELTVTARELRDDGPPALLASGVAHVEGRQGDARSDDHARARRARASSRSPSRRRRATPSPRTTGASSRSTWRASACACSTSPGDPTNDVRALRQWLKSDASVDVVAFFILRTPDRATCAPRTTSWRSSPSPSTSFSPSTCRASTPSSSRTSTRSPTASRSTCRTSEHYVRGGGGLVMVGGQNSFVAGGYAGTPLAEVLPVALDGAPARDERRHVAVRAAVDAGGTRRAAARRRCATSSATSCPTMPGANVLGDVRPGGVVLWTHPTRTTPSGAQDAGPRDRRRGRRADHRAGRRRRVGARVLGARRADGRPRARRALGRAARLADARPALRAGADRDRRRLHGGAAVGSVRARLLARGRRTRRSRATRRSCST